MIYFEIFCLHWLKNNPIFLNAVNNYRGKKCPYQWPSVSIIKTGRRKVSDSISSRACQPNRSEFSVALSETCKNMG